MKKPAFPALVLCGTLVLTLTACGSKEPDPTPEPTPSESVNVITPEAQPTESVNVVVVSPEVEPTESMNVIPPEESGSVAQPVETQSPDKGSELAPTPEPTPAATPEPTPEPKALTASEVYAKVAAAATGTYMIDTSFALDAFYPDLSEADFEDFVLYMPDASANIEEILIGKVASGRMDAVKAACQGRQQAMKEDAQAYATTGAYVDSYQLVTEGDWVLFCVCPNPTEAVTAFRGAVK